MKHSKHLTDQDLADLQKAAELVEDGRALRRRVFSRLRARAYRRNAKDSRKIPEQAKISQAKTAGKGGK